MNDGFPGGSMRAGIAISAVIAAVPAVGMVLGFNDESMTWGEVVSTSLQVAIVVFALVVVLPAVWRYVRRHARTGAAHAREHRSRGQTEYGRVYPSGPAAPDASTDGRSASRHPSQAPPFLSRWWFSFEGWQQASIVGTLVGVLIGLGYHRALNHDGLQLADLLPLFWVWAISLWLALAVWTGAYINRAHPNLRQMTIHPRLNPGGCVGFLAVFEVYPQAVWFLIVLLVSVATAPARLVGRRLRR